MSASNVPAHIREKVRSRWAMEDYPDLKGFFQLRQRRDSYHDDGERVRYSLLGGGK